MKKNTINQKLSIDFYQKCEIFIALILKYNKIHNITGAKNKRQITKNIEDSIYPIKFLDLNIKSAIDIGSGAGFPGLILAMALPEIRFSLFEPIKKKGSFLHLAKSTLNLKNVDIISQRVEEVEAFEVDLICSRAVTKTEVLIDICRNFISKKTTLLFYKGSSVDEELDGFKDYKIYNHGNRNYLIMKDLDDF